MADNQWIIVTSQATLRAVIEGGRHTDWLATTLVWQRDGVTWVAGALCRDMGVYPFLDIVRQWRRLGVPRGEVARLVTGLRAGWPIAHQRPTLKKAPA